jgi:ABC-type glycerol-3-phosphate transport system permease component
MTTTKVATPTTARPAARTDRDRMKRRMLPPWLQVTAVTLILLFTLLPIVSMLLVSVMPDVEAAAGRLVPTDFAFENYLTLWQTVDLAPTLVNSFIVSVAASTISTALAVGIAYCLVRFTFVGRRSILRSMLGLQTVPGTLLLLPLFVVFFSIDAYLGLTVIGTRGSLVVTYMTFALPFATWIMVTYLRSIPISLEEAGLIDGLSRIGVLRRIITPLALPGMVVATIFSFLLGWNDVLFASVLTAPSTRTAAIQLSAFAQAQEGGAIPLYGQLMAASVVTAVPVVVLYLVFQRYLAAGLTSGGVKG